MALLDILELGDLLLSWRLYVGIAITALLCWLVVLLVPSETISWTICVPLGITGLILSFRWQVRADFGK
jgi:hypothetical protein